MVAYVFQTILNQGISQNKLPTFEKESVDWYRAQAKKTTVKTSTLLQSDRSRLRNIPRLGDMYMYAYDPKTKDALPYYDTFPLVIPFDTIRTQGRAGNSQGFMGLNLHYLPYNLRALLMDHMLEYVSNDKMDETTRLKISYRILKRVSSLRYYKPCVKQYLASHMRSKFFYIDPKEWNMALFLRTSNFIGTSEKKVWQDSRDILS